MRCAVNEVKRLGKTAHDEPRLPSIPLRLARNVTNDVIRDVTRSAKMHAHGMFLFEVVVEEPILHGLPRPARLEFVHVLLHGVFFGRPLKLPIKLDALFAALDGL